MATQAGKARIVRWMQKMKWKQSAMVAGVFTMVCMLTVPATRSEAQTAPTEAVRPLLTELNTAVSGLNVPKWKAPGAVRNEAQDNVASIQRDISGALPGLLEQANAAPAAMGPQFAVYRNVDALYDVLLRLSETADLAAPEGEAQALEAQLGKLQAARKQLGDAIMQMAADREAELVKLRAAAQAAAAAVPQATPKTTVVDDGPQAVAPKKKKRKPAATAAPPAASAPQK